MHEISDHGMKVFIDQLPQDYVQAIDVLWQNFGIKQEDLVSVITTLLMTLSGWSSYMCYQGRWKAGGADESVLYDYVAIRLLYMYVYGVSLAQLKVTIDDQIMSKYMDRIQAVEQSYHQAFLSELSMTQKVKEAKPNVQFLFCIDVRSEPMRKCLQQQGDYQTFGVAGFFGIPMTVKDDLLSEVYHACPVLIKPDCMVINKLLCDNLACAIHQQSRITIKTIFDAVYKALKYTFTAPFALVEILGPWSLIWMLLRTINPCMASKMKDRFTRKTVLKHALWPDIEQDKQGHGIALKNQIIYARQLLQTIGLIKEEHFASLVVLTAHASKTTNNAYETLLDCGACGGNSGLVNAKAMATILNNDKVRKALRKHDIMIPDTTYFIAAEHNTTTDKISLYDNQEFQTVPDKLKAELEQNLQEAREQACKKRKKHLPYASAWSAVREAKNRSCNWSEIVPEWGLAKNAAMIIGPSWLTDEVDLYGRVFLHSYEHGIDQDGSLLTTIMTGPMVVAHWINAQYLFSTIDNRLYGSGSKVTQNVMGKIGVMQGNLSDMMTGLSVQSVYSHWDQPYHEPIRLMVVVCAYKEVVRSIVMQHEILEDLCKNEWLYLVCFDPKDQQKYQLQKDLIWKSV